MNENQLKELLEEFIDNDIQMINIFNTQQDVIDTLTFQFKLEVKRLLSLNNLIDSERIDEYVEAVYDYLKNILLLGGLTLYRKPSYVTNSIMIDIEESKEVIRSRKDLFNFFTKHRDLLAQKYFCTEEISSFNIDYEELKYDVSQINLSTLL